MSAAPQQAGRLRALREELNTLRSIEAPDAMPREALAQLHELLETDATFAHGLSQAVDGERYQVTFQRNTGALPESFASTFSEYVGKQTLNWAAYHPASPEPEQRNVVVTATAREMRERGVPVAIELFPKVGLAELHQIRLLVCEGPSLLAWVGGWRAEPFDGRQAATLEALLPDLLRRFSMVRQLARGVRPAVLEVALDAIGRATFLIAESGEILEANAAGAELLRQDVRSLRAELLHAVQSRGEHPRWQGTRVRAAGQPDEWLVIVRPMMAERVAGLVREATSRWSLSPRQREVLGKLAEGNSNQTIAAMLGITERTVEAHVTALLDRSQVESRAELIVKLFTLE